MINAVVHPDHQAVTNELDAVLLGIVTELVRAGVHPTNAVGLMMAVLARELGRQTRKTGRQDAALRLVELLKEFVTIEPGDEATNRQNGERIAKSMNTVILELVGVTQQ